MNVVIIEDELPAYTRLAKLLKELLPTATIVAHHDSVQGARQWFEQNNVPDLVLMDVQLADGTAFDLLQQVKIECPIIFTTAYDTYAVDAFKATSIDYILKPIKKADLEGALRKLKDLQYMFRQGDRPAQPTSVNNAAYKKRFLIRFGEHIKTVAVENIAYCCSENRSTFAQTHDGHRYPMDHNLDTLETMLDPNDFFRINRQYLISLKAIDEMKTYSKARVIVRLKPAVTDPPVVSSERAAEFKQWLAGDTE
ncbi:MAG: response regulator transcription factor [Taibaiella sp.]|nr:response regulator transcription factor [Taibaiella sp.]